MSLDKKKNQKSKLHSRNRNRERYDLKVLTSIETELKNYIRPNKHGDDSIDFSKPLAVKLLNKAILNHYYGIKYWEFPDENLCPPIPGRADYIHHMADLLCENNFGTIPTGDKITCLDIGIGANCIYPIIGVTEYQWKFIGSDINPKSIESAQKIISSNPSLIKRVECRLQNTPKAIFNSIIDKEEKVDITLCNPPFHSSIEDAQKVTQRKIKNLSGGEVNSTKLNLAGVNKELLFEGGEIKFIQNIIRESKANSKNCFWFSTLVSKQSNLKGIYQTLEKINPYQIKTIPMGTSNKSSRIVAWTFLSREEQKKWKKIRWKEHI
ncbi:MAG: 23S rRNA (adenine(1618)-N(6))-methyltransferase RlmF [Crocinitomicaceae bacterium]